MRELREAKSPTWSQGYLADKADLSRNFVGLLERGEIGDISAKNCQSLADALDVDVGELMGLEGGWLEMPALREFLEGEAAQRYQVTPDEARRLKQAGRLYRTSSLTDEQAIAMVLQGMRMLDAKAS